MMDLFLKKTEQYNIHCTNTFGKTAQSATFYIQMFSCYILLPVDVCLSI